MDVLNPETAFNVMQQSQVRSPLTLENSSSDARIQKAAEEFEAVFFAEMMKPMFEGLEPNETFGGGKGEEIFSGMMIQEYGKEIAKRDITGIQTAVRNALIEMQVQRSEGNISPVPANTDKIIDLDILEETK